MAAPNFINGKLGTISINGSFFFAEQYTFQEETPLDDITYTVVGGQTYQVLLPGYNKVSGDITFVFDTANQPTVAPYNMLPGMTLSMILYPDGTKPYTFSAFSGTFKWGSGPKAGTVRCTTSFQSSGVVTHPSS